MKKTTHKKTKKISKKHSPKTKNFEDLLFLALGEGLEYAIQSAASLYEKISFWAKKGEREVEKKIKKIVPKIEKEVKKLEHKVEKKITKTVKKIEKPAKKKVVPVMPPIITEKPVVEIPQIIKKLPIPEKKVIPVMPPKIIEKPAVKAPPVTKELPPPEKKVTLTKILEKIDINQPMKILVVEDEDVLSKVMEEKFKNSNLNVKIAVDGEQALALVKSFSPNIIMLDLNLPKVNGFDVLKSLKTDMTTKDIPVVVVSNLNEDNDIVQVLKMGAEDYYVKSTHPINEIVEKVKAVMLNGNKN